MKMKYTHLFIVFLFIISIAFVVAEDPPSLTGFHQFYGEITDLPNGTFELRATVNGNVFTAAIDDQDRYGYSPTFKIQSQEGSEITFTIVETTVNTQKEMGKIPFHTGAVTQQDFDYVAGASTEDDDNNEADDNDNNDNNDGGNTGSRSGGTGNETDELPEGSCRQSWVCSIWSSCRDGTQTRSCFREDSCDQLKARGEISEVIEISRPEERRVCGEENSAALPASTGLCASGQKRCLGQQLQQCAITEDEWLNVQFCSEGCDSITLRCKEPAAKPPSGEQEPFPAWILYILGILVLITVIAIVLLYIINEKKSAPAKDYIAESRMKGLSDEQIKRKLVSSGWDEKKINKLLK